MISTVTPTDRPRTARPLSLLAALAGFTASGITLGLCLATSLVGWFLADAGAHGEPRDALRSGALAWLSAHGSGLSIDGIRITAVPLGLTLLCLLVVWRTALRLGESLTNHGPDADDLADGVRDWTVHVAVGVFAAAYLLVTTLTSVLAAGDNDPSLGAALVWTLGLCAIAAGPGIAIGSGRAATWLSMVPEGVRATATAVRAVLVWFLGLALTVFVIALLLDFGTAANVLSQMHTSPGDAALYLLLCLLVVPNAVIFAGSYLLGPGFLVGTGTLVSPTLVAIGPVPLFPLLAALPDNGETPAWTAFLVGLPVLVAALAVARTQRVHPTIAWEAGAVRGLAAGVVSGLLFGILAALAGGAVGPGRMADVGPVVGETLVTGIVAFGLGGLLGGVLGTWWTRRRHGAAE
ncbi:DUF6350 domain-containing protein [Nocardioides dubius]|uniref:DUF6350 family protein n=1 Tax=Nocardioides dubius TaxID=317019 RepID=A0ABN1U5I8_9ACTN